MKSKSQARAQIPRIPEFLIKLNLGKRKRALSVPKQNRQSQDMGCGQEHASVYSLRISNLRPIPLSQIPRNPKSHSQSKMAQEKAPSRFQNRAFYQR
jgi:hypothetical protein